MYKKIVPSFFLCVIALSCSQNNKRIRSEFLPKSRGEADEIILVMDSTQWVDSKLGEQIKKTLKAPMRGLPQDEALFNVSKVSPRRLNSVLKSAKNMVIVMTLDCKTEDGIALQHYFTDQSLNQIKEDTSTFMRVREEVFARNQKVLFLFSSSADLLENKIKSNRLRIQEFFESSARETIKSTLFSVTKKDLGERIKENHGVGLTIPYGWEKARDLKNFFWLRLMNGASEQSLFLYYEPYTDSSIFSHIDKFRDKITQRFLYDGENTSVHITRQPQIPVFTNRVNFNGHFALKSRGLWKISDNSRGGPFVSYAILDEETNLIYYIEGYVDSPGTQKKNLIRELEVILSTLKTKSDLSSSS